VKASIGLLLEAVMAFEGSLSEGRGEPCLDVGNPRRVLGHNMRLDLLDMRPVNRQLSHLRTLLGSRSRA
jgi:hypothetical protein